MGMQAARKYWLWVALTLTFSATVWVSMADEGEADPVVVSSAPTPKKNLAMVQPVQRSTSSAVGVDGFSIERLQRPRIEQEPGDLFPPENAAQGDAQAEESPPPVTAPPLPYTYAGRLMEDGRLIVFLLRGTRHYSIQVGEIVDNVWQLVSVSPQQIVFNHTPTRLEVVMPIGENH